MANKNKQSVKPNWDQLRADAVVVNLFISRWQGSIRTNWAELGLPKKAFSQAFTPGARKLLPAKIEAELDAIIRLVRTVRERMAIETPLGWIMSRERYQQFVTYITETPAAQVRAQFMRSSKVHKLVDQKVWDTTSLYTRFIELRDECALNREMLIETAREAHRPALNHLWGRHGDGDMVRWVNHKLDQMVDMEIPPSGTIKRKFEMDYWAVELDAPTVARVVGQDVAKAQQRINNLMDTTINRVVEQLHGQVYDLALQYLEIVEKNGSATGGKVAVKFHNLIDYCREFLGGITTDAALKQAVDQLDSMVSSKRIFRDEAQAIVSGELRDIAISMKAQLAAAGLDSRSGRSLGVPDNPSVEQIEMARRGRSMDMELPPEMEAALDGALKRGGRSM